MTVTDSNAGWAYRKHGESKIDDVHDEQEAAVGSSAPSVDTSWQAQTRSTRFLQTDSKTIRSGRAFGRQESENVPRTITKKGTRKSRLATRGPHKSAAQDAVGPVRRVPGHAEDDRVRDYHADAGHNCDFGRH